MTLDCYEVVYNYLNLPKRYTREFLISLFCPGWTVRTVISFLRRLGWYQVETPETGDLIMVGPHPGVVEGGRVRHIHHGQEVYFPLCKLKGYQIFRRIRCQRRQDS
jgi:hypothetical protein